MQGIGDMAELDHLRHVVTLICMLFDPVGRCLNILFKQLRGRVRGMSGLDRRCQRFALGAAQIDTDTTVGASAALGGREFQFEEGFELGNDDVVPRIEALFRITERNRLLANYLRFSREESATLDQDIAFEDVLFPAGSRAEAEFRLDLASLMYEFAAVENEDFNLGLQFGAYWADAIAKAQARVGDEFFDARVEEDGMSPTVGLRLGFSPGERWRIGVRPQYFDEGWGDFSDDMDGSLSRANALVEYRFTDNFGAYVGYDWFKLELTRAGRDATGSLDLRFKGPMAGVTAAY